MNRLLLENIFYTTLAFIMIWIGMLFYLIGIQIYGSDSVLMFAGGVLAVFGTIGIANVVSVILDRIKDRSNLK